jgi:hypothetical protein
VNVVTSDAVVDDVLDAHRLAFGRQFTDYRNHVYRGLNYQLRMLGLSSVPSAIGLAWAAHDAGIWTARTWDYIEPSATLAREIARDSGVEDVDRVGRMITDHHKVRPAVGDPWVETFRLADRIDVFRGATIGTAVTRRDVSDVVAALPYGGFHTFLVRAAVSWTVRHPLRPMPMMRW